MYRRVEATCCTKLRPTDALSAAACAIAACVAMPATARAPTANAPTRLVCAFILFVSFILVSPSVAAEDRFEGTLYRPLNTEPPADQVAIEVWFTSPAA